MNDSLASVIAFMYRGLDGDGTRLESIIEDGVYAAANVDKGGRWAGDAESVSAEIDIDWNPNVIEPEELSELETEGPVFPGAYFGDGMGSIAGYENRD